MVNTRSQIKKSQKRFKTSFSQEDSDQQLIKSGTLIGSSDDILTEIFLRLPVTSIIRFKSVCKHWQWLLSQRHFTLRYDRIDSHLKSPGLCASKSYILFDVEKRSTHPLRNLDYYFSSYNISIRQSCNGLLLCRDGAWNGPALKYYVFNPTIKQFAIIPYILGGVKVQKTILFMGLAFHQTGCVHYKVVCIRRLVPRENFYQIQVYSSDTSKWKIAIESFYDNHQSFGSGVYWNGAFFWNGAIYYRPPYLNSLYFKFDTEQLLTLPLPVGMNSFKLWTIYFGESRGHLHLIPYIYRAGNGLRMNVYEMLSDFSGWFVKYQVELDQFAVAFPEVNSQSGNIFKVVDVVRGEKEEDTIIVLNISEKMITYNVHRKSFKVVDRFGIPPYLHRYTEILSSF